MPRHNLRLTNMDSHKFLFSNVASSMLKDLMTKVKSLGGSCIDSKIFEKNVSHLVCGSLKKTEKFFGACICGKWIISPQYIIDSYEVGMWLDEENYLFRVENKDLLKDHLALTARRWRNQVHFHGIVPFQDWKIALLMTAEKANVFKRLLRYGGAEIIKLSVPFSNCAKIRYISYVFVDDLHIKYVPELQEFGLLCLKEKFLGDFILKDPSPDPFDYIITGTSANETLLNCSVGAKDGGSKCVGKPMTCPSPLSKNSTRKVATFSDDAPCSSSQSSSSVSLSTEKKSSHTSPAMKSNKATPSLDSVMCKAFLSTCPSPKLDLEPIVVAHGILNGCKDKVKDENIKQDSNENNLSNHTKGNINGEKYNTTPDKQSEQFNTMKGVTHSTLNKVHKKEENGSCVKDSKKLKQRLGKQHMELSNIKPIDKTDSYSKCINSLRNNLSSPHQPNPIIDLKPQAAEQNKKLAEINAQENDISHKTSRTTERSQFALEYLDPNVPSDLLMSSSQNGVIQKDQKHLSISNSTHHTASDPSSPVRPKKVINSTPGSARKRKLSPGKDSNKLSKQKRRNNAGSHTQGTNKMMSAKFHLDGLQVSPTKITAETAVEDHNNPHFINKMSNSLFPITTEGTPPKLNQSASNFNQTESNIKELGLQSSSLPQSSIFKTPIKTCRDGLSSSKEQKSPSASMTLSPNVYLYGLSPVKNWFQQQNSAEKKVLPEIKSPSLSGKSSSEIIVFREKQKPTQSTLQQFGFRSVNKYKDGPNSQHTLLKPKSEPISQFPASQKKKPKSQMFNILKQQEGEIIILSDDETESIQNCQQLSQKPQKFSDVITVSSSTEEESVVEIDSCGFPITKQSGVINISTGSEDDKNNDCGTKLSSKKVMTAVGNVFENISSLYMKGSEKAERGTSENLEISLDGDDIGPRRESHPILKKDESKSLCVKRQLFCNEGNTNNNSDKIDNFTSVHEISCSRNSNLSAGRSSLNIKQHVSETKAHLIHHQYGTSSSELDHSDTSEECKFKMDKLPNISWPPSFFSSHVTSNTTEKQFVPSIVSQCMESSREIGFYSTALEHGKPTLARMPNVDLLSQLIQMLTCDDFILENQAFSDLMLWVQSHPPTSSSMIKIYSDLFELTTDQTLLCNLLQGLSDPQESKVNCSHLLEFIVTVFEVNFSSCLQSQDRKTVKDCLLIKWLWSHSQAIHHNSKTKELLRTFEAVLSQPQSSSSDVEAITSLISMVAECYRLNSVHWNLQNRNFLSDTVTSFALDIAKMIRDTCPDKEPFYIVSHLRFFKPAWFQTLVTACILSFSNDYLLSQRIQVRDLSLHAIVSQYFYLLPPLSSQEHVNSVNKPTVLSQSSQHQEEELPSHSNNIRKNSADSLNILRGKNLVASKVNRVNGKGESALHIAAKKGDVVTMKKLLHVPGVDVNLKDNNNWTALHEACNHGKYACVELLLKYVPPNTLGSFFHKRDGISSKVDINVFGDENITPLHDAVLNNHVEICKLLLKHGGKHLLETKTVKGYTALDLATTKEMYQVLSAGLNNNSQQNSHFLNLSQDSQSEDSLNLSQSEYICSNNSSNSNTLPSDFMYEQVLNVCDNSSIMSASYSNCSAFISLITLLLNSYLDAASVKTQSHDGIHTSKISLLKTYEANVHKRMRFHIKLFKKHLKKITRPDTFDCLQAQLLMLSSCISH